MKVLVFVAFAAIIASLGSALFYMLRRSDDTQEATKSRRMARALALRVGFSILLFVAVLVSHQLGWIQPTGIPVR
jgi:Protein of unknown function (DUF2909)